jgi:hypothetical protein
MLPPVIGAVVMVGLVPLESNLCNLDKKDHKLLDSMEDLLPKLFPNSMLTQLRKWNTGPRFHLMS